MLDAEKMAKTDVFLLIRKCSYLFMHELQTVLQSWTVFKSTGKH